MIKHHMMQPVYYIHLTSSIYSQQYSGYPIYSITPPQTTMDFPYNVSSDA